MKKCIVALCLVVNLLTSSVVFNKDTKASEVHVVWTEEYESIDEMAEDAEIIAKGKVIEQRTTQTENGTVYTISTLDVISMYKGEMNEKFEVKQLGGETEEFVLNAPEEAPLLKQENEYIIFAKRNSNSDSYYIMGAGQGVFDGDIIENASNCENIIEECAPIFNTNLCQIVSARTIGTPSQGYKWNKSNLTYDVGSNINVTAAQLSAIKSGTASWSGIAGLSLTEAEFADITIRYESGELDNVCGYATPVYSGSTIVEAHIRIYTGNTALTSTTRWKTLACHEVGHCLGLSHYTATSSSVMYRLITDCASYPQEADIIGLNNLYL